MPRNSYLNIGLMVMGVVLGMIGVYWSLTVIEEHYLPKESVETVTVKEPSIKETAVKIVIPEHANVYLIMVEGHKYLVIYGSGITHSESCSCKKQYQ